VNVSVRTVAAALTILNLVMIFPFIDWWGELRILTFLGPYAQGLTTEVGKEADQPTKLGVKKLN
jgi:hypothetical protein